MQKLVMALLSVAPLCAALASGSSPAFKSLDLKAYTQDSQQIQIFPASDPQHAVDLQLLRELDATSHTVGPLNAFTYHVYLNGVKQHPATIDVLNEADNAAFKSRTIRELRRNLESFINTGAIESIGPLLEDPKNKEAIGEGWKANVLLQQLTLELLAKWELEQLRFMTTTANMKSLAPEVQQAYDAKCIREVRAVELLYQMTGDKSPVGIETENAYLLLYHVLHGSLVMSSGCPAHIVNHRAFKITDKTLPFNLPNIRPVDGDGNLLDSLTNEMTYWLQGIKTPNNWGQWRASLGRNAGEVLWNVQGFMNYGNTYSWGRWGIDVPEAYKQDEQVLGDSQLVMQNWSQRE